MKEFFAKLGYKLRVFMTGRTGPDELYRFLNMAALVLIIIDIFVRNEIANAVLFGAAILLLLVAIFRAFSKNAAKRRAENAKYLAVRGKVTGWFKLQRDKVKFRKTHVFRTCPNCKRTLRLPRKKGEHSVTCPVCKTKFSVKVR